MKISAWPKSSFFKSYLWSCDDSFAKKKKCTAMALYLYFTNLNSNCSRSVGVKLGHHRKMMRLIALTHKMKWISLTTKLLLRSRRLSSWPRPNASRSTWWRTSHCHVASSPNWVRLAGREQTQSENTNTLELQVEFNDRLWLFTGKSSADNIVHWTKQQLLTNTGLS